MATSATFAALPTPEVGAISAGAGHTLALKADGTVWAWGNNTSGQLGEGTTTVRTTPRQVDDLHGIVAVSAGRTHSLALDRDGTVWAWGANQSGELGDGTTVQRRRPVRVSGLADVVAVAAGGLNFSLALQRDGTVSAWGNNFSGQLGDNTRTPRLHPVKVRGLDHVTAITAGNGHAVALKDDGTVWTWGANFVGQLGDGTQLDRGLPTRVANLDDVIAVSASSLAHTLALKRDGTVWAWGNNLSGQLGGEIAMFMVPVKVAGLANVVSISAGSSHNVAQLADGAIWVWGSNTSGQLGFAALADHVKPRAAPNWPDDPVAISASGNRTVVLTRDGRVLSAGNNDQGQWGDNTAYSLTLQADPTLNNVSGLIEGPSLWVSDRPWTEARSFSTISPPAQEAASR